MLRDNIPGKEPTSLKDLLSISPPQCYEILITNDTLFPRFRELLGIVMRFGGRQQLEN